MALFISFYLFYWCSNLFILCSTLGNWIVFKMCGINKVDWTGQIQDRLQQVVKLWSKTLSQRHVYIPVRNYCFLPWREQDYKQNHHCHWEYSPQASTQRRIKHEPGLIGGNDKYSLNIRIHSLCQKGVGCVNLHTLMMKASVDFKVPLSVLGQGKVASRKKSIFSCWFGSSVAFSAALIK